MLLGVSDVLSLIPVTRVTLYNLMNRNDFPKPVRIGSRVFWKREEILAYIDSKQDKTGAA